MFDLKYNRTRYYYPIKYNRYARKEEEEPKTDVYQKEVVVKEERRVKPKRFGYSKAEVKEESPQIVETKKEVIESRGRRPEETSTTTKQVVFGKSVVDKKAELENKNRIKKKIWKALNDY